MNQQGDIADVVRRARRGDPRAREAIMERVLTSSLRTAIGVLGNRDEASDVAQEVGIRVLTHLGRLRRLDRFDVWVQQIATRETWRALGHRSRLRANEGELDESAVRLEPIRQLDLPDDLGRRTLLIGALAELPPRQRLALVLRYVHDLSEAETADALGCTNGTAASVLSRARSALRRTPTLEELRPVIREGGGR